MAERLALPTSDHGVAGSNPTGSEILPEPKRCFIAQSLSCSPFHRLEMTEILLKGGKTLTHPFIHPSILGPRFSVENIAYVTCMLDNNLIEYYYTLCSTSNILFLTQPLNTASFCEYLHMV